MAKGPSKKQASKAGRVLAKNSSSKPKKSKAGSILSQVRRKER